METERFETVIVGGGQAGLTTGYHLGKLGRDYVILDAHERIGDAWRKRWDSLRLFTPALFDGLPGMRFPAKRWTFPTKDEMADYLERYAARFDIPVRTSHRVDGVTKQDGRFIVSSGGQRFEADNVVIAAGAFNKPKIPMFAGELDANIVQMHSGDYRSPSQLRAGRVLLVGLGNSGAEISYELAKTHQTMIAGKAPGQIPVKHGTIRGRFGFRVFRFFGHNVVKRSNPIGRKLIPKLHTKAAPLIRRRIRDLDEAGVVRVPRLSGVQGGMPLLEDGRVVEVENVIWCTGFQYDFSWVDLPVFTDDGEPVHERGVATAEPGLTFVGLIFQYSFSSDVISNRGRDAGYVAKHIATRGAPAPSFERVTA